MNFIDKLEQKFHGRGIKNLTLIMIVGYVVGYFITLMSPALMYNLNLNVSAILQGQIWRLITWVIAPPNSSNVLLFAISILFFYYPLGNALEKVWGSFRYTLYILSGLLFTVIGAFVLYFITGGILDRMGINVFTTYYITLSVFLAFATMFPDMQLMLWFVIPVRMKWMAVVYLVIVLYPMINYFRNGAWFMIVPVIASLLNFIIFFIDTRRRGARSFAQMRRQQQFRKAMQPRGRAAGSTGTASGPVSKHKCAICGRTELSNPELEFRFCSKCRGNYEYCQDHLFTHQHVE